MNLCTSSGETLEDLLVRYQSGDAEAARTLVTAFSPALARFCRLAGDAPDDVDDVLQEIWLRVHKARHTYRAGAPAAPWLFAIARHTRLDAYRKRRRVTSRETATDKVPEVSATHSITNFATPASESAFPELLAELPASQREVLTMLKGMGMSLEEVARATSSTVGGVKQKAHRAYKTLRQLLANRATGTQQT